MNSDILLLKRESSKDESLEESNEQYLDVDHYIQRSKENSTNEQKQDAKFSLDQYLMQFKNDYKKPKGKPEKIAVLQ